ncbi:MAG: sialidase family protein [Bacteroidota bacterium]
MKMNTNNTLTRMALITIGFLVAAAFNGFGQTDFHRNAAKGNEIFSSGYADQPYVEVLDDGTWFCVFTTGKEAEGSSGQHIVYTLSEDQGKSWTKPKPIEPASGPVASWIMPYKTNYGRIYIFYIYNGDRIETLNGEPIRNDMLGWYCYRYTDNKGKTWSGRHRLPVRKTHVDSINDWNGEVQIMWGIGKPIDMNEGMMFAFTKIGKYMLSRSEGWFFKCSNIDAEQEPEKLNWKLLPEGNHGLRNPKFGPVQAEQNIVQMNNGDIYCMYRTITGHPINAYSRDGGKSWTEPEIPEFHTGNKIKNPRACPRIWKCKNGKYLFWHHNNGWWNYQHRNPAWISGGIEKNGRIIWTQPEILLYEKDPDVRMSYPDLIEQNDKYWITETNKETARTHKIDPEFFNLLWNQFDIQTVTREGLVFECSEQKLKEQNSFPLPDLPKLKGPGGITLDMRFTLQDLAPGQALLDSRDSSGQGMLIETGRFGAIELTLSNGEVSSSWSSDRGLIKAFGTQQVTAIMHSGPRIITFVVNGIVCDGRNYRAFGWARYDKSITDINGGPLQTGNLKSGQGRPKGKLKHIRIYNNNLMHTEAIGNHRALRGYHPPLLLRD